MRISDWSSDVCSSDLHDLRGFAAQIPLHLLGNRINPGDRDQFRFEAAAEDAGAGFAARAGDRPATQRAVDVDTAIGDDFGARADGGAEDRKSVVEGKSVSVRVELGGLLVIKKKKKKTSN